MAGLHRFVERRLYILIAVSTLLAYTQSQDIGTIPVVSLERRRQGAVPCPWRGNHGDLDDVTWMKGVSEETAEVLVSLNIGGGGTKSGPGYDDGTHDITDDLSLLINYVEIDDEGLYACNVALGTGETLRNYTDVRVYAPPAEPFPRAEDCQYEGGSTDSCTISTSNKDPYRNVTCYALAYYPSLSLSFTQAAQAIQPIDTQEVTNIGGTKSMNITIRAEASDEPYLCKASGIPGQGQEDRVLEILVRKTTPSQPETPRDIILIVLLTLLGVVVLIVAGCMVWRYRSRQNSYRGVSKEDERDQEKATKSSGELKASSSEVIHDLEEDATELQVIPEQAPAPIAPGPAAIFPEEELKEFADNLTGRHCRILKEELGKSSGAKSIEVVIRDNSVVLFDTDQLLRDWHGRQLGNHGDRRKKLDQTAQKIGREDLKDPKCIDDDELHQLVTLLDSDSLKSNVCEILGVKYSYEDEDGEFFQKLCEWRRGTVDGTSPLSVAERHRRLLAAYRNINISKSSTFPFKRQINESRELYEISCQLLLHDVRPLAHALGIKDTDLDRYSQPYQENNGKAGTMSLMKGLYEREEKNWEKMCKVLKNMGYYQAAQMALSGNYRLE